MRILFFIFTMLAFGISGGLFFFDRASSDTFTKQGINNGPWTTNLAYGDKDADPLLKSSVARRGLLALNKSETVYFTADYDSAGDPLSDQCSYRVKGPSPKARWSSYTLYGEDNFLIPNKADKYSYLMPDDQAQVDFTITPKPTVDYSNIPSSGGGKLSLTLRLYNPTQEVYENLKTTPMPIITKEACL